MPIEIIDQSGKLVQIKVNGVLAKAELDQVQGAASKMIEREGKINVLVLFEDFQGWEKGADWADMAFVYKHDKDIEKMAMVGDPKWAEQAQAFAGKPYTSKEVEFFDPSRLDEARTWLAE
jgi:hypothetical protein